LVTGYRLPTRQVSRTCKKRYMFFFRATCLFLKIYSASLTNLNTFPKEFEAAVDGAFCNKIKLLIDRFSLFFSLNVENRQRKWSIKMSETVKSRQSCHNGHLPYHCLSLRVHAWRGVWIFVRSKDTQKQLAPTSSFSSLEATLLLVSTKNCDLWEGPTPEVRDAWTSRHCAHSQSQVWQIWLTENTKRLLCACTHINWH